MLRNIIVAILFVIATVGLVGCSNDSGGSGSSNGTVTVGGGGS